MKTRPTRGQNLALITSKHAETFRANQTQGSHRLTSDFYDIIKQFMDITFLIPQTSEDGLTPRAGSGSRQLSVPVRILFRGTVRDRTSGQPVIMMMMKMSRRRKRRSSFCCLFPRNLHHSQTGSETGSGLGPLRVGTAGPGGQAGCQFQTGAVQFCSRSPSDPDQIQVPDRRPPDPARPPGPAPPRRVGLHR